MNKEFTWKQALQSKRLRLHLFASGVGAIFLISFLPYFFNDILQPKAGVVLNDFILAQLHPTDWSWIIFGIIYLCVLTVVVSNYSKPFVILIGVEAYIVINLFRMITLYSFTLEPPHGIIPLIDPVITKIAYGDTVYLKDLFFSGHVSTLSLLFLIEGNMIRKTLLFIATIVVAFLILWQHVHYTVDVLFAPIFTGLIYFALLKLNRSQFNLNI